MSNKNGTQFHVTVIFVPAFDVHFWIGHYLLILCYKLSVIKLHLLYFPHGTNTEVTVHFFFKFRHRPDTFEKTEIMFKACLITDLSFKNITVSSAN